MKDSFGISRDVEKVEIDLSEFEEKEEIKEDEGEGEDT